MMAPVLGGEMKKEFLLLVLALSWGALAQHDVDSAFHAFQTHKVWKNLLIVKSRKTSRVAGTTPSLDVPVTSVPVFPRTVARLQRLQSVQSLDEPRSELETYSYLLFDHDLSDVEALRVLKQVFARPETEFAFFEVIPEDATWTIARDSSATTGKILPNFEGLQFHLKPSPVGINARYAWTIPGGTGRGVRVLDFETGWIPNHVEFRQPFWANSSNAHLDHGTAVWGEIAARRDGIGTTGIAYDADFGIAGTGYSGDDYNFTVTRMLDEAISHLTSGDLLVIEQQFLADNDTYVPIEFDRAIFDLLKTATGLGIHCVAAAGNGSMSLDDPAFQGAFDLSQRDSGCVIVGAAGPPGKTHLQRLDFSNYGSRVDAFGYGQSVVTTGYGDLFYGAQDGTRSYTRKFDGTSSATPMVAGAMASALGAAKAAGRTISPEQLREALRRTGTAQAGRISERIGKLPDLRQLLNYRPTPSNVMLTPQSSRRYGGLPQ